MRPAGLTLVEVLVALVVASVSIAALAASSRAAVVSARQAARLDEATRLAAAALEERLARPPWNLSAGTDAEPVLLGGAAGTRRVTLSPGPRPDLWRIVAEVADRGGIAARLETLRRVPWRPAS